MSLRSGRENVGSNLWTWRECWVKNCETRKLTSESGRVTTKVQMSLRSGRECWVKLVNLTRMLGQTCETRKLTSKRCRVTTKCKCHCVVKGRMLGQNLWTWQESEQSESRRGLGEDTKCFHEPIAIDRMLGLLLRAWRVLVEGRAADTAIGNLRWAYLWVGPHSYLGWRWVTRTCI